jgi:surfeit locus 1 family protein
MRWKCNVKLRMTSRPTPSPQPRAAESVGTPSGRIPPVSLAVAVSARALISMLRFRLCGSQLSLWQAAHSTPCPLSAHRKGAGSPYAAKRYSFLSPTFVALGLIPVLTFALGPGKSRGSNGRSISLTDYLKNFKEIPSHYQARSSKSQLADAKLSYVYCGTYSLAVIPEFVYRRVTLRGTWDHAHSMLLGPRVLDGTNGFHLITPLVRGNGSTILVDRGFISEDTAARRSYPTPDEEVEVRGMLRESQARNSFTPDNNAAKGEWYWADVTAMADYAGGESSNVQSVLVEETFGESQFIWNRPIPIIRRGSCWGGRHALAKRGSSR